MDGTGEREVNQVQKAKVCMILFFLSYVEYRPNINTRNVIYETQCMYRCNANSKIPLNNEQTPKE
jgi:hypothetical protein